MTQRQAEAMTPATLADALLAPGHPPIVAVVLPDRIAAPLPPPPYVPLLDVRLVAAATLDRASGFCVKRSWRITGSASGEARTLAAEPNHYRLSTVGAACEAPLAAFFTVAPGDRPRAVTVVRLLAGIAARPQGFDGTIAVAADSGIPRLYHPVGREAGWALLGELPLDHVFVVRRAALNPVFGNEAPDGRPRETWELYAADRADGGGMVWTIDLALDGDDIAAIRLRHEVPPPF